MSQATYVQRGEAIDYTPTSDVAAGQVVVQSARCGVASTPIAANEPGGLAVGGLFNVVKATGAINVGAALFWDADGNPLGGDRRDRLSHDHLDRQHVLRFRGGRGGRDRHDGPGPVGRRAFGHQHDPQRLDGDDRPTPAPRAPSRSPTADRARSSPRRPRRGRWPSRPTWGKCSRCA